MCRETTSKGPFLETFKFVPIFQVVASYSKACKLYSSISTLGTYQAYDICGASVAKWLAHLPFTSKAVGSNLSENFSM